MMSAKEYLKKIRMYDTRIESKLLEVQALRAMVTKITPTLKADVVTASSPQDKLGDAVAKIIDLETEIDKEIDAYVDLKREVTALLERLENPFHYKVLHQRYFLYHTFERIATDMHYSFRGVCYLHGRALQAFDELLQKEEG